MSRVAGYFLILNDRHVPLVCFITNKSGAITHIGHGKRGVRAGTDLRRLNIEDIFELKKPVSAIEIANTTGSRVRAHLINKINSGGLFSPRCFEEFLSVFLRKPQIRFLS